MDRKCRSERGGTFASGSGTVSIAMRIRPRSVALLTLSVLAMYAGPMYGTPEHLALQAILRDAQDALASGDDVADALRNIENLAQRALRPLDAAPLLEVR